MRPTIVAIPLTAYTYIIFNRPVTGKTTLLRQKLQQTHYYYRVATKLRKAYQYLLLKLLKYWWRKKTVLQEKLD